jgi:shikimate kinase
VKIILIGFMGCGKSTVAKLLTDALHVPNYEMDDLILTRSGRKTVSEIFELDGEPHFRALESTIAQELGALTSAIISTGGGVITNPQNMPALRGKDGVVAYLAATLATITKRIGQATDRPLFRDPARAAELYKTRREKYERSADFTVATDNAAPAEIARQIETFMHQR